MYYLFIIEHKPQDGQYPPKDINHYIRNYKSRNEALIEGIKIEIMKNCECTNKRDHMYVKQVFDLENIDEDVFYRLRGEFTHIIESECNTYFTFEIYDSEDKYDDFGNFDDFLEDLRYFNFTCNRCKINDRMCEGDVEEKNGEFYCKLHYVSLFKKRQLKYTDAIKIIRESKESEKYEPKSTLNLEIHDTFNKEKEKYKLILVGYANVGKTSFVDKIKNKTYNEKYIPTLGVNVTYLKINKKNFEIWDTAGQEKYKGLDDGYYTNSNCAIIMYDSSSEKSYDYAKEKKKKIMERCGDIPIIMVANKIDIFKSKMQYGNQEVIKISVKKNINIEKPFNELLKHFI